jgi:hypothetical protein
LLKLIYDNTDDELKNNKCIVMCNGEYYAKLNNTVKKMNYEKVKTHVIKSVGGTCDYTLGRIDPDRIEPTEIELPDNVINMYKRTPRFVSNIRNNGIFKKSLNTTTPDI